MGKRAGNPNRLLQQSSTHHHTEGIEATSLEHICAVAVLLRGAPLLTPSSKDSLLGILAEGTIPT